MIIKMFYFWLKIIVKIKTFTNKFDNYILYNYQILNRDVVHISGVWRERVVRLAQLVERKTFNLVVVGSSPTADRG